MKLNRPSSQQRVGFTLIEVLIAVSIFAMVLLAINSVFYGAMRLQRKTSQAVDESLPAQQAVALIKRDLQGIVAPGRVLAGPLQSGAATIPGQSGGTAFYTDTGALEEMLPWGDIQQVVYFLRDPVSRTTPTGKDLMRVVSRNLLATIQEQPVEQFLMSDVAALGFSYYDGTSWRDAWDTTTPDMSTGLTNTLPKAIRVEIDLAAPRGELHGKTPIQLVVPVVVQVRTNATQTTGGQG
ncbi:MAG: prepilin-type N-terminal cleavage/methylation domain-containing protein [Verrucomicrobia bacterium]|nr:prepilin-type N-terminal cleavage/methylation domain-containing protein [Verrucomicrobiota bacterium]